MTRKDTPSPGLPSKEKLAAFIRDNGGEIDKHEIARAFGITGQDRTALRILLRELAEKGVIEKTAGKTYAPRDALPETAIIEIEGLDGDGELRAKPAEWHGKEPPPAIYVLDSKRSESYLQEGARVMARLKRDGKGAYEARVLRAPDETPGYIVGIFKPHRDGGYVYPTDKKNREDYFVPPAFAEGCDEGDLVIAECIPPTAKYPRGKNPVRIAQKLGKKDDPRLISLIAIHTHGIPTFFSAEAQAEAEKMKEPDLSGGRVDIRDIPLVTIDGEDARDFDDAVFAEPDPETPGGWRIIVAIADVSHYVRHGSALDRDARERGNSTYFSDRVVPMLPERLSNDLCSLRPGVPRACLAAGLRVDANGDLKGYGFFRGLMRSAARLTYEQAEAAHLGSPDGTTGPLMDTVISPLYRVYGLLRAAREKRGALDLDLPERKALIDDKGNVTAIVPRKRLESHKLIEELMILANVAAAMSLEDKNSPCMYRVHDAPAADRLETTRDFLKEMGYSLPETKNLHPRNINHILKISADRPDKDLIHTILLRTQSQALYSPDNKGHFGLALEKYAHFTSPIRRYADLVVHRSLTRAWRLGEGGLTADEEQGMQETAEHISSTERRSVMAERDVNDRFTAQYLSANVGKDFAGRISGVTRFGLFVTLLESGADGIVPMRTLPGDFYIHDEKRHALVGKRTGRVFRLADPVAVRLREADPMRGSTVFELLDGGTQDSPGRRNRPAPRREKPRTDKPRGRGGKNRRRGKSGSGKK